MKVINYTPGIPTGDARTHGWGKTVRLLVLRVDDKFKTLNSVGHYEILENLGTCRVDYGLLRGKARKMLDKLTELRDEWRKKEV